MKKTLEISYEEYAGWEALPQADAQLLREALAATHTAYAPYSHFQVGAALRLADGTIATGSNQENVAYPSGLCAERTALFAASAQHPNAVFTTLAIVARNPQGELAAALPCGACRQVMLEYEERQKSPLRVIVYLNEEKMLIFHDVASLMPFSFAM